MRRIDEDVEKVLAAKEPKWWPKWLQKARKAIEQAKADIANNGKHDFTTNSKIWGELKEKLAEHVFHGKCAYCESRYVSVSPGDAEHYRPKGKVTVLDDQGKTQVIEGHKGYYWLAWDWRNLLPACSSCNSSKKLNHFPLPRGKKHITKPECDTAALDRLEKPLLLNPYRDDPAEYLAFDENGSVAAIDGNPRGEASIRIYGLDRDTLRVERAEELEGAWDHFSRVFQKAGAADEFLKKYDEGRPKFVTAVLQHLDRMVKLEQEALDKLKRDRSKPAKRRGAE